MSYQTIQQVSLALREVLLAGLQEDTALAAVFPNAGAISLASPAAAGNQQLPPLSLWLYQVVQNEHLRNASLQRTAAPEVERYPPLTVNLSYLITPATANEQQNQLILGKALQTFHDNAIVRPVDPNTGIALDSTELHLNLAPRAIEELAEVWEALQQPYRLSVCYDVRVVQIESQRLIRVGRVADRTSSYVPREAGV